MFCEPKGQELNTFICSIYFVNFLTPLGPWYQIVIIEWPKLWLTFVSVYPIAKRGGPPLGTTSMGQPVLVYKAAT